MLATTSRRGYGIDLVQPIFTGFRVTNAVSQAEAGVRAGREGLRRVEQEVLAEAVTTFMEVVRDQAIVRLNENNVKVLSEELKATQDRFSVGEVTRTDVAQSEARRARALAELDLARGNYQTSTGQLRADGWGACEWARRAFAQLEHAAQVAR